jgi:lipoyl(octanoyl) transferase
VIAVDLGRVDYTDALALQHRLAAARSADLIGDVLLVCEHPPVYTAGRNADLGNVRDASTIPLVRADRGGDVTYHGPGQVVIYPLVRLAGPRRVRSYVEALQDACVSVAAGYGITAHAERSRPGVWVGSDKLAAIGVRVQRGSTSHGLAFNVDPDLADFDGIVPCGIPDGGVCSLASLGVSATVAEVRPALVDAVADALERPVRWGLPGQLDATSRAA